ncbi:putative membrane protein [Vulgatibacter incomptus]|uniref:Putative membrane protein n=1 Tax=Vulgatibacter incomptus TaxID=1391653 RepID=A0A0K1PEN4_9BACT|nr:putative membrane protein [Vulgatibacter incomptus]
MTTFGTEPADATDAVHERVALPFHFTGNASEYFRIWIVNVALSIVTLGIYSAWAKVRNKQYFYRHTWLDGASFDYLADPRKILKGRILVAAALGVMAVSKQYSAGLYLLLAFLLMLATPWVLVKAFRFSMRNSAWRNVRFSFRGTTSQAAGEYLPGMAITMVTLGIGAPWLQWRITRFVVESSTFGKLPMRFRTRAMDFARAYWGGAALLGLMIGILVGSTVGFMASLDDASRKWALNLIALPAAASYFVAIVFIKTRLANLVWGGIEIGEHRLASAQKFRQVLWLQFTNILAIVCTLGLAVPWARVRNHRYRLEKLTFHAAGPLIVAAAAAQEGDGAVGDALHDLGDFDIGFG